MKLHELESFLPHWFAKPELQWIQWAYALWQTIRSNPLALFALSYLPFCLRQMYKKKTVLVVGETSDYLLPQDQRDQQFCENVHRLKNIEILVPDLATGLCCMVKYCGHCYLTHYNGVFELTNCAEQHGDITKNIMFVERLLTVTGSWAVGKEMSHKEAYEKLFTKRYHLGKSADVVVPSIFNYVDLSSKVWGILSTLPILLQARNYNRISNLLSLLVILLDCSRHSLYKFYDNIFGKIVDLVKLNFFKKRQGLYEFFSIFSKRWRYTDTVKKHAYVAEIGTPLRIRSYCKMEAVDDLQFGSWNIYRGDPNDRNIFMEIVDGRAHVIRMKFDDRYSDATFKKPVFVP